MAAGASAPLDAGNDDENDVNDDKQQHHHHPLFQHAATTEPSEAAKLFRESVKKHVIETRTETTLAARRKSRGDDALDEQGEEEKEEDEGEIKEDRDDDDTVARYQRQKRTSCVHEVAIPKSLKLSAMEVSLLKTPTFSSEKYAKKYAFELDAFQSTAVAVLERGESVMVAAHTSAGKTVVAEYAIAMAFRDKQRVIYTSPLKALSNQKFRELEEEFGDVGLMTGDTVINPNATCLVMTTEVLRSMLYRGGEVIREVRWIIFDEVHYMRDRERGVVWEESIVFAPKNARLVFLSATLPNALEFAEWVASLHEHCVHVVYTDHRPTPLQHYGFPKGGKGLHLIVDEVGNFRRENFEKLRAALKNSGGNSGNSGGGRGGRGPGRGGRGGRGGGGRGNGQHGNTQDESDILRITRMIKNKEFFPVIVFSFSRRECEEYAKQCKKIHFNDEEEAEAVEEVYTNALKCLDEEDRKLPAVQGILPLLKAGIGIHHSGLLPCLKELVEILFSESLIKCLFATETFAMGLNMPARTVVFTAVKKFDGNEERVIAPGEYTQMSGRAGRRGKDDRGICIVMADEKMEESAMREMLQGKPQALNSEFKLSYYSILNLLKRASGTMDAEFVIQRSFHSYQHAKAVPGMKVERDRVREEIAGIDEKLKNVSKESTEYGKLIERARRLEKELKRHELEPTRAMKFLTPGRLLKIRNGYDDFGWGCVVNAYQLSDEMLRMRGIDPSTKDIAPETVVVDCLMRVGPGASEGILTPADVNIDAGGTILEGEKKKRKRNTTEIVPVSLALVANIGELILELSDDLRDSTSRDAVYESVRTIVHTFKEKKGLRDVPSLDAVNALGCVEVSYASMVQELESVREKIKTHQLYEAGDDDEEMYYEKQKTLRAKMKDKNAPKEDFDEKAMFEKKATLEERSRVLSSRIKTSELSKFRDELSSRSKVLRKLNHVDAEGVVLPKGRCACEIDTADELLATELMFNGAFAKATPRELVALCSMFVPTEKSNQKPTIPKNLEVPIKGVLDAAKLIANTQLEQKLEIDVEKYVDSFRTFLVEIVHEWAGGKTFSEVLLRTDLFEGTIVRAMRRLDELMLELGRAAMACGDENLREKFEKGAELLRRGIVFAPSLYV